MNIGQIKDILGIMKRQLPEGKDFAVFGDACSVVNGQADECVDLDIRVDLDTYNHLIRVYGEIETRRGTWVGHGHFRVFPSYNETRVQLVNGIPCDSSP